MKKTKKRTKKKGRSKKEASPYRETCPVVEPLKWDEYNIDLDIDSGPESVSPLTNGDRPLDRLSTAKDTSPG